MSRRRRDTSPDLFSPRCGECGAALVTTASGFVTCPAGHGRLVVEDLTPAGDAEECGSWFAPDVPGEER